MSEPFQNSTQKPVELLQTSDISKKQKGSRKRGSISHPANQPETVSFV